MTEPPPVPPRQQEGDHPTSASNTRQPPSDPRQRVLHHTPGRYLVVDKPFDVRIDGPFTHTVETLAAPFLRDHDRPSAPGFGLRFVHRLDYATSGVLLIGLARTPAAVAAAQFEQRQVRKHYVALVHGHLHLPTTSSSFSSSSSTASSPSPSPEPAPQPPLHRNGEKHCHSDAANHADHESSSPSPSLVIDAPIADGLPEGSFHMMIGTPQRPGRPSRTRVSVRARGTYRGAAVTLVQLEPLTGRRHQLRVHLAHRGWPIVGDATYGEQADHAAFGALVPPRMMLHARRLDVRLAVDDILYGRKSALRTAKPFTFDTGDPFTHIDGLILEPCA